MNDENSTVDTPLDPYEAAAYKLQLAREELQRQEDELIFKKQQADEAERQAKLDNYQGLREDAAGFRATAAKETDETSKKMYIQWALDADRQAVQLGRELGLAIDEPTEPTEAEKSTLEKVHGLLKHRLGAIVQISLLVVAIIWASSNFTSVGDEINTLNKALPVEQQMNAYDITSNQKFFFEKYVEFWDLPVGLFKLLILVPFVGLYLLPFIRSRKDFFTEFFEDLTPFQRCLITFGFVALFILHSALSHGVKP
ncbi:hypothetical protein [Spirosoma spitsbergense]|uniref:hypothetical protein n=1 Tax=Spirosoma spitsbergense TaxID=431554 RepID=UPI000382F026|nr:hypothetical protein [Spirosoma spitsbergense]